MLPGKKYKPEDILQIVWTRLWIIVLPFVVVGVGAVVYAMLQPNRYRAQTSIVITPQQVPKDYVESTITTMLDDRLQVISQQILSRTRLERIIEEFNLYPEMRGTKIMEDVVEQMRTRDIVVRIDPKRRESGGGAFTVSFEYPNARTALLVTERLASLFIRESVEDRAVQADATSQFLDAQLEEARRRLIDHEKTLEEYKRRNSGSLPSQVQTNLQAIQTTQLQLQSLEQASNQDRDRRLFLERALSDAQSDFSPVAVTASDAATTVAGSAPAAQRLEAARTILRGLETRLKPEHPDVLRAKRMIRDLEKEADAEALQRPVSDSQSTAAMTPSERNRQSRITEMRAELEAIDRRLNARQVEEGRLRGALGTYQARLDAAPGRESEMIELMRDYDTLKTSYNDLLRKSESSKLSVNLERRQIGEQFKIIDGARLPERPVSPNRPQIIGMGAILELGLGLGLVGLLEYRDSSLKTDEDVVTSLSLPVLALIPAMVTKAEERTIARRRRLLALTSVTGLVVLAAGAAVWKLQLLERWIG